MISKIKTQNGQIALPAFMPCATRGAVRAVSMQEIEEIGFEMVLVNAYHLYLTPGLDVIKKMGGLHSFMGWKGAILCDSGGFQVFSLKPKISDRGVRFQSHIDGSFHELTPEKVWQINQVLGSDIIMPLDDCPPVKADKQRISEAVERTHNWLSKTIVARNQKINNLRGCQFLVKNEEKKQLLFGIVQGGVFKDLRKKSAEFVGNLYQQGKIDGIAVGGVSVGENKVNIYKVIKWMGEWLPKNAPKYLMGVGEPEDIIFAVQNDFCLFDCVLPTRLGRHGTIYQWKFQSSKYKNLKQIKFPNFKFQKVNLTQAKYKFDSHWAYWHHLIKLKEIEGLRKASIHNLKFYYNLIQKLKCTNSRLDKM